MSSATEINHPVQQQYQCTVCNRENLEEIISLPNFPFTGIYCSDQTELNDLVLSGVDQALNYCPSCGHAQLQNIVDPGLVYDDTYTHRTSVSALSTGGNDFFSAFLEKAFPNASFRKIIDIGCNDGYLLSKLEQKGESLLGVDPIWIGKDHKQSEKITIVGGFIEEVDLRTQKPDLIVSAHTFEHIANPRKVFEEILPQVDESTKFIIEVPSFDTLVRNHRFDQVFHQHIQYFSVASFCHMIRSLGCRYITHTFNYSLWGGTMLFAFEKGKENCSDRSFNKISREEILAAFVSFQNSLTQISADIAQVDCLYGFGAAQMLPTLAYHMPCHLSKMGIVLDDNPARQGYTYPNLPLRIASPESIDFKESEILVTALDSARPILRRLFQEKAKRILLPMQII